MHGGVRTASNTSAFYDGMFLQSFRSVPSAVHVLYPLTPSWIGRFAIDYLLTEC